MDSMKHAVQHEIAWTLIKKAHHIKHDQVIAVYEDHAALRERLTELNKKQPNAYTISSICFYPKS